MIGWIFRGLLRLLFGRLFGARNYNSNYNRRSNPFFGPGYGNNWASVLDPFLAEVSMGGVTDKVGAAVWVQAY